MLTQVSAINSDGGEYATMAEHLVRQHALIGVFEGPAIVYAPLYPILIAAVMQVIPNSESAAEVVSLLSGTALIAIVFHIARHVYSRRIAMIAATIVACHPLLIGLSASVYNETLYLTLWTAMAFWALRAMDLQRFRDSVMLGVCVGLLYLSRVEAAAYLPLLSVALAAAGTVQRRPRTALAHVAIVAIVFLTLASPYVAYLERQTHHLRLEAKWNINLTIACNRLTGMTPMEASYAIGRDLSVAGPLLDPFHFTDFSPCRNSWTDRLRSLAAMTKLNAQQMYHYLLERQFGSPLVWMLIMVGWFSAPWTNRRLQHEGLLVGLACSVFAVAVTSAAGESRYLFALLPLLLLWCSNGLRQLANWISASELLAERPASQRALIRFALPFAVAALMVAGAIGAVRNDWYFAIERGDAAAAARDAGMWLERQAPQPKRIADRLATIPYYAKGTLIAIPYADSDTTLRYFARKRIDFIVLESADAQTNPTVGAWISRGIPDLRARLVYDKTTGAGVRIVIYQWRDADSAL